MTCPETLAVFFSLPAILFTWLFYNSFLRLYSRFCSFISSICLAKDSYLLRLRSTERTFSISPSSYNYLLRVNTYRGQSYLVKCHCTNCTTTMKFRSTFHRNTTTPCDFFPQLFSFSVESRGLPPS